MTRGSPPPAAPPPDEETPFGTRYLLIERLGKGGMGEVWKARDLELNQLVALKMIRTELLEDPGLVERFKHEITLARKVTHRNVTRIHDLGEVGGVRFISMEYLEGRSLKQFVRDEGPLDEEKAIPILRGICEGLQAAHEAGVVHRDLKPQNILIDPNGGAHIMDFGIAFSGETSGLTQTGALIGTPEYMSPEQVRGEKLDARSDIYSLGLIIYEMVTGDLPFTGDTISSTMYKRLSEKPRRPREIRAEIPPFLEKIILRCIERERDFRYAGVAEILADLGERKAPRAAPLRAPRLLRSRWALAAAAVGVLALATGILVVVLRGRTGGGARTAAPPGGPSVAVLPFENGTGDPALDWTRAGFPGLVAEALAEVPEVRVVDTDRTRQTLEDLKISLAGAFTPLELRRAASVLGAEVLVTGVLRRAGDTFQIDAKLQRPDRQQIRELHSLSLRDTGEASLFSLSQKASEEIARALEARPVEKPRGVGTRSVEALKLFSEGRDLARRGRPLEAAQQLEQAVSRDPGFAIASALLSQVYGRLGQGEKALESSKAALQHLSGVPEREAHLIRARHALLDEKLEEGVAEYRRLLAAYPRDADARYELGVLLEQSGDLAGAAAELERSLSLDPRHTSASYALGRVRFRQGEVDAALKIFSGLLGTYTEASNEEGRGTALLALGNVKLHTGGYAEALDYYRQSLAIRTRLDDKRGMAVALSNIANVLRAQARFDEAIRTTREALELRIRIGDRHGVAVEYKTLGEVQEAAGRITEAKKSYQEALKIARELDDPALLAGIISSLGYVSGVLGDYGEAYLFHQDALEKRRKIGDKYELLRSLIDLGLIEQYQGRYDEALQYVAEATGIVREIGEKAGDVVITANLGQIHDDQGSYAAALQSLSQAADKARKLEEKNFLVDILVSLAGTLTRLGRLDEATEKLAEAEATLKEMEASPLRADLLMARAEVEGTRGNTAACLRALGDARRMAESVGDRRQILLARLGLGRWMLAAGNASGRAELAQVAEEAGKAGLAPLRVRALAHLAEGTAGTGNPPRGAVDAARQALKEGGPPILLRECLVTASGVLARAARTRADKAEAKRIYLEIGDIVRQMREGLEEPYRSSLPTRPDLARLSRSAEEFLAKEASPTERERFSAAFSAR
jgi:tetratricopeptide (TPR) repeat protein